MAWAMLIAAFSFSTGLVCTSSTCCTTSAGPSPYISINKMTDIIQFEEFIVMSIGNQAFLLTFLMTPTATVRFMSLIANRPKGGYQVKLSTQSPLVGRITTKAESPFLRYLGASSVTLPVLRSILAINCSNLQAMWAVWQSKSGVYPSSMFPGWFITMIWASNVSASLGALAPLSPQTYPLFKSCTGIPLTQNPTLSPGIASSTDLWCISTVLTSDFSPPGEKVTFLPGFRMPVSMRPAGTVPIPPILQTSCKGIRRGFSVGLLGGFRASRASIRVGPLYHFMFSDFLSRLSPVHPERGTYGMSSCLNPTFFRKSPTSFLMSWQRCSSQLTEASSILLMQTMTCLTPRVKASKACSLVWPYLLKPASNSPFGAATMSKAQSAWEVPVIMFLMKSLCPGASMMVKWCRGLSNCHREMSMVIPLSLSAFILLSTQAYLKDPLFCWAASFSYRSMVRLSMPPHWQMRWPAVVDLPLSTCPITTKLKWLLFFSIYRQLFFYR